MVPCGMNTHRILLFIFTCTLFHNVNSLTIDSTYLHRADSIMALNSEEQMTLVDSRKEEHTVFQAMTVKRMHHPYEVVTAGMKQWYNYAPHIKYMRRAIPIKTDSSNTEPDLFFVEMGVWIAVSWLLGRVTVTYNDDSTETFIFLKQSNNPAIYKKWKREARGLIKVEYHDFIMWYRVTDMGNGETRVALISFVEPKIWIPKWLFRATARKIFPGMVSTIESLLDKHAPKK